MSPRGEFACRFGTYVTRLAVWARWSAGIAAGGGLGWAGVCCVRGRRRTIAIVAEWWSIEVLHGEVSAFRWQEQHDSALIEAALTNGVRDGAWHADRWGVVFEVLFDAEDRWEAFRGLPVVRAALDAVPDPVNGLLIYRGRGGGAGTREPRRPKPAPGWLPFRCPGPRTSRIWIWRLSPHRPPGRRRQGRYSGRRIRAVPGLAEMTLLTRCRSCARLSAARRNWLPSADPSQDVSA